MFNFGFDPEQFASLGSSFDEPDPFAPEPLASVAQPALINPARSDYYVLDNKPKPAAVAPTSFVPDVFSSNSGASFTAEDAQAEKDSPTVFQSGFGAYAKPDTKQNDYSGRTNLAEFHDTAYSAMQNNDAGYESNRPNPFTGDINLQAYQGSYIAPVVRELKEGGYTAFQKQEEGAITKEQVAQGIMDNMRGAYVADNPITQDFLDDPTFDATKLYMNTGGQTAFNMAISDEDPNAWRERDKKGKYVDISGGRSKFGDYSMVWVENPKGPSGWDKALNNPVINVAASLVPFGQVALTAAKAANGQTLHGMDYLGASLSAAKGLGMLQAPVSADEARKIGEVAAQSGTIMAGPIAENAALAGKGLTIAGKTLTYNQSVGLLSAAATGDPKSALVSIYGGDLVKGGLERAGISSEVLAKVGIPADAFESGLQKTIEKVAAGEELDEALAYGFVDYAKEGGLKNLLDMPESDISFGGIEDVVRDIVRPIGSAATALAKAVENSIPDIDTSALDPLENAIREVGRTTEDVVRAGGSAVDDAIIQPVRKIAKDLDDAVFQPVGDALSAADTALRNAMPDIDLPSINLPNIDLPNFSLPSLGMGSGMLLSGMTAPTATTGKLFENELFKFKNKIELTEFGPLNQPEQEVDIEEFLTSPFESAFTSSQRFA